MTLLFFDQSYILDFSNRRRVFFSVKQAVPRTLPLKANELVPYVVVLVFGRCNIIAYISLYMTTLENIPHEVK